MAADHGFGVPRPPTDALGLPAHNPPDDPPPGYGDPDTSTAVPRTRRRRIEWIALVTGVVVAAVAATAILTDGSTPKARNYYPADGGVLITEGSAHFQARFPVQPILRTQPASFSTTKLVLRIVGENSPATVVVEEAGLSEPMKPSEYDAQLLGAIGGFEGSSGLTLKSQEATTFLGHPARRADMASLDATYAVLYFIYSGTRIYGLVAPKGPTFDTLAASFSPLP